MVPKPWNHCQTTQSVIDRAFNNTAVGMMTDTTSPHRQPSSSTSRFSLPSLSPARNQRFSLRGGGVGTPTSPCPHQGLHHWLHHRPHLDLTSDIHLEAPASPRSLLSPKTLDSRLGPRDYRRCAPARARKTPTRSLLQHTGHAESTQLLEAPLLVYTSRPTASAAAEARTQILFGPRAASCTSRRTLVAYHTVWRRHAPSRSNTFHIGAY